MVAEAGWGVAFALVQKSADHLIACWRTGSLIVFPEADLSLEEDGPDDLGLSALLVLG